jgi:hypothetical protein
MDIVTYYGVRHRGYEKCVPVTGSTVHDLSSDAAPIRYGYALIEHTSNVAPSPEGLRRRTAGLTLEKRWPLYVGPLGLLDYTISLYSGDARRYGPLRREAPD